MSENRRKADALKLTKDEEFRHEIARKEERKRRARREKEHTVWFGLGMFGLVGWAVAIPTLLGIAIGVWLDTRFAGPYSWTLMLLFIGIVLGCVNAWFWVKREGGGR